MVNNHDIAIRIEHILRDSFGFSDRPRGTIFDADLIETRSFYDCVHLLLYKHGKDDYTVFLDSLYDYSQHDIKDIPNIEEVYNIFLSLLNDDFNKPSYKL